MASASTFSRALRRLLPTSNPFIPSALRPQTHSMASSNRTRSFHSTPQTQARQVKKQSTSIGSHAASINRKMGGNSGDRLRKAQPVAADPKLMLFRKVVGVVRKTPPPLIMGRNRHLRHWTIHRAWQLHLHKQRDDKQRMLMRQWHSMRNACEELRQTSGPGTRDEGYLYRVAMEKKGVYGHDGFPIEYARPQVETPARQAWNHDWRRD
ncbi:hypothetical protein MCOR27_004385 [Pyricularia oryzae]|uniref:Uncharacterized protein n=2 Tax=Pyricularia TaxID=48558 RepID=A0ABQ8NV57_PYRGI|nr:hypothetical protein MCOR01_006492 [Pyricularia oryzae]KAI6302586.1 hypothetical protein MCOR33_002171 [Pyricularia grisea]KAH9435841.1 hypothetical protein MCOR02_004757 [Pyricularia oryzae]KAI6260934.1 hypothetical protein MCOR19_002803 [Pyricularia oryzae]KAI6280241.1 hypothetical protein MCOR26_003834 [Pyricularia oryzae]